MYGTAVKGAKKMNRKRTVVSQLPKTILTYNAETFESKCDNISSEVLREM